MLKSIGAVAVGVIAGAILVFLGESIATILPASVARFATILGWCIAILAGGCSALFMGRRWAPVAWVVAVTLFGFIAIQLTGPWWMTAGAIVATFLGGFGAIKLMRGSYARPIVTKA